MSASMLALCASLTAFAQDDSAEGTDDSAEAVPQGEPPPPERPGDPSQIDLGSFEGMIPQLAPQVKLDEDGGQTSTIDTSQAVEVPTLSEDQYRWLEPKKGELPDNPYAQVDFTAYTLEWGEFKLGLSGVQVGLLPRTQVGTMPILWALGVENANAKLNAIRLGPVDIAGLGRFYRLDLSDGVVNGFVAQTWGLGGRASIQVTDPWSVHLSLDYDVGTAGGLPDFSGLSHWLSSVSEEDLKAYNDQARALGASLDADARVMTARVATDVRFNRRDSLILQGSSLLWASVDASVDLPDEASLSMAESGLGLPPLAPLEELLAYSTDGKVPLAESWAASLSWHMSMKSVDLRIGAGLSSVPGAWVFQANELSIRFGGKTRGQERRMRNAWRSNRDEVEPK